MPDTQPRELTALELQRLQAPPPAAGGGDAAPLAVPPGTSVPVHLIDPTAGAATAAQPAQPTQEPPARTSGG